MEEHENETPVLINFSVFNSGRFQRRRSTGLSSIIATPVR